MNKYYFTNRSKEFSDYVVSELEIRKKEILDFFEFEDDGRFNFDIYIYDTQKYLVEGLRNRCFRKDPDYMCACFKDEDHSLNYFEPNDKPLYDNEWSKEEYINSNVIFHEEIHGIQSYIYGVQPEWLTEGIAVYLDGTYSKGISYLIENYIDKDFIPSMHELKNEFGWHQDKYDAYDYAYLIVSYLIETSGKSNFIKMIHDSNYIKELEDNNIVETAINYYNCKKR